MKYLVVYDTSFGNTERIALAIQAGLGTDAEAHSIATLAPAEAAKADLLVLGSPTQGGRPTKPTLDWLARLPKANGRSHAAAFDTRLAATDVGLGLRLLMGVIGYAAPRISAALAAKGFIILAEAKGFIVTGKEGPLATAEVERAEAWGRALVRQLAGVDLEHA